MYVLGGRREFWVGVDDFRKSLFTWMEFMGLYYLLGNAWLVGFGGLVRGIWTGGSLDS